MIKKITLAVLGLSLCYLLVAVALPKSLHVPNDTPPLEKEPSATSAALLPSAGAASIIQETQQRNAKPTAPAGLAHTVATQPGSPYAEKKLSDREIVADGKRYPLRTYRMMMTPNDPAATQWWTDATGLPAAWDYGSSSDVKIAIIDSGFALNHEEFAGRWAERASEKGVTLQEAASDLNCTDRGMPIAANCNNIDDDYDGVNDNESGPASAENPSRLNCSDRQIILDKSCNMIDDDNNGFVDDVRGWDFASGDSSVQAGEVDANGEGASHGTSVTGVAAANGNNGVGMAGVNWSAKILPLQALDDDGTGTTLSVSRAIRYAADQGVDVINLSLGSEEEDSYLRQAVQYALERGAVVVAASGNEGCECISYPARYPEVVAVGAFRSDGTIAGFSNFGDSLDIAAPGTGMYLPIWTNGNPTQGYSNGMAGTSFATPFVSGLLASARAKQPDASWGQLVNIVLQTSDHRTLTTLSPRSPTFGAGYVDAASVMSRITTSYRQPVKYVFRTDAFDSLGANTVSQCEGGQWPTAPFYEIKKSNNVYYSISELAAAKERSQGSTVTQKGYACVGLPSDNATHLIVIDSAREFSNATFK